MVSKFVYDTIVATSVKYNDGCMSIQDDLNKLIGWADRWQMDFNSKKYKTPHLVYSNKEFIQNDLKSIQDDLDKLIGWADRWLMGFNSKKCKTLHLGYSNKEFKYDVNCEWLQSVDQEKDLGVIISGSLKVDDQCLEANKILAVTNQNIVYKSKEVISKLYNSYVRPLLEHAILT